MRVGLVSPYSYTYPGGVGRHAEALTEHLIEMGHEARLLAPYDPDDRLARVSHRGARPQRRPAPDYLIPLGRTVGIPVNGSVSNLALSAHAIAKLGRELRAGGYDVLHVHEPNAPVVSWYATEAAQVPLVGTFHTHSTSRLTNGIASNLIGARRLYNKLHLRIAVSEAARWTAERFYGGRYRIIPNGVDLAAGSAEPASDADEFRILFIGRADERKGLPVLLRAFEALRVAGVAAHLTVAGPTHADVGPYLIDDADVEVLGPVGDDYRWRLLRGADVLCAPSLGGESFGMVLTEAFAAGTPVVASDIAGYREVASHGVQGLLVPSAEPAELGEALHALATDADRRARMAAAARKRAKRYAWPRVAEDVAATYREAIEVAPPSTVAGRIAVRTGVRPANPACAAPPRRLPPLEPRRSGRAHRTRRLLRRGAIATGAAAATGLTALALSRLGIDSIVASLLAATPVWVLMGFALMCASMLVRAEAWTAILRAAIPGVRVRRADTARATMIGVLMSATLPVRLGEPSRALIVARRLGRVRERLPVVLGTLVSQTLLNIVALVILGVAMLATVGLFQGNEDALVLVTLAPVGLLAVVLAAPALLRRGKPSRYARVRQAAAAVRSAMVQVRRGLQVFRSPRLGTWAAAMQLAAWTIQWLSCYVLLVALGLDERAGFGAAAAVLFAVNVTAVLPALPSNIGVFQAVCVAVLSAYGVGKTDALAYGIVLQAVEIATSLAMGMPALVREGVSWRDMRIRALHAAPVELSVGARRRRAEASAEA